MNAGASSLGVELDASFIARTLSQGSRPRTGEVVVRHGYDVLALCELQWQPRGERFPGVRVVHIPIDDENPLRAETVWTARRGAKMVADHMRIGRRALVCCHAGLNRSGLVCALVLRELLGLPGAKCREMVQACRPGALFNSAFASYLDGLR